MSYEVIKTFTDLTDKNFGYVLGDTYPREGLEPTQERIAELSGDKNKRGISLIKEVNKVKEPEDKVEKVVDKTKNSKKKME